MKEGYCKRSKETSRPSNVFHRERGYWYSSVAVYSSSLLSFLVSVFFSLLNQHWLMNHYETTWGKGKWVHQKTEFFYRFPKLTILSEFEQGSFVVTFNFSQALVAAYQGRWQQTATNHCPRKNNINNKNTMVTDNKIWIMTSVFVWSCSTLKCVHILCTAVALEVGWMWKFRWNARGG